MAKFGISKPRKALSEQGKAALIGEAKRRAAATLGGRSPRPRAYADIRNVALRRPAS